MLETPSVVDLVIFGTLVAIVLLHPPLVPEKLGETFCQPHYSVAFSVKLLSSFACVSFLKNISRVQAVPAALQLDRATPLGSESCCQGLSNAWCGLGVAQ